MHRSMYPTVRPWPAWMIPCPKPEPILAGQDRCCPAPLGAHPIEVPTVRNCYSPCPPMPGPASVLPGPACVPLDSGDTRGGIFGAPWVTGTIANRQGHTVPQNCGPSRIVPQDMTPRPVGFARSPYADPRTLPSPCPPDPCAPSPCMPSPETTPRPVPQRPTAPETPRPVPTPRPTTPTRPTPTRPTTPTPTWPGPSRPTRPTTPLPTMPTPPPPWVARPAPKPSPIRPGPTTGPKPYRPVRSARPQGPMSYAPCDPGWARDAQGVCRPEAIRGYGGYRGYGGFGQAGSGIFETPNCPTNSVPFAPSPYQSPVTMPPGCPPRRPTPRPCPPGAPMPVVPPREPCPPAGRGPNGCAPGLPYPVVPPNEPCAGFYGFGSPDGLYGYR